MKGVRLFDADRQSEPIHLALDDSEHSESGHEALSRSGLQVWGASIKPPATGRPPKSPAPPAKQHSSSSARSNRQPTSTPGHRRPLPRMDELLPNVELSAAQEAEMRAQAEELIAASVLKSEAAWGGTKQIFDEPKHWKLHYAKTHVAIYRHRGPGFPTDATATTVANTSPTAQQFVATGRVPGLSLTDVEYGRYSDTTLDERAACAYLYRDYFLDAAVLRVIDAQTEDDPFRFFGIKWLACSAPRGHNFFSPRDFAFYEYAKTVQTASGARVLVKVVRSVPDAIVPQVAEVAAASRTELPNGLRFVRAQLAMTSMYRFDAKTNAVQVFAEGAIDPCGRASSWLGSAFLSHFVPPIVRIEYCADIKYIMKHGLVFPHQRSAVQASVRSGSKSASASGGHSSPVPASAMSPAVDLRPSWVPDHQRKVCFVCFKSFGLVRRHRHHCRMCGEVMCGRCMIVLPLVAPPAVPVGGLTASGSENTKPALAQPLAEPHISAVLQQQPAKKELEATRTNGYPAVNAVKLCKKCMFTIRQERKGVMYGASALQFGAAIMRQFPIVLQGTRPDDQYPYHPFPPINGLYQADDEDDDDDVDDETYSRRIEALRRAHLDKEKLKNARTSIRLYDEDDLRRQNGEPTPKARSGDMDGLNFDDLLLPPGEQVSSLLSPSPTATPALASSLSMPASTKPTANELFRNTVTSADAARRVSVTLLPESRPARSYSIPDQLEQMERSIAEQEALLLSIAQERYKIRSSAAASAGYSVGEALDGKPSALLSAQSTPAAKTDLLAESDSRSSCHYGHSPQTAPTAVSTGST